MTKIDKSMLITAAQKSAAGRDAAGAVGRADLIAWVDRVTLSITGDVPKDEKLSWSDKAAAARAVLSGQAADDQLRLIEGEAEITGETVLQLAEKIVENADGYAAAISALSGLRRVGFGAIDQAQDAAQIAAAVEYIKAKWLEFTA